MLAKQRNVLISRALQDEDWVLWLDVDVNSYSPKVLHNLIRVSHELAFA